MNEEEIYNTIEDINNTTTEEGDATSEETENNDLLNTVISTVVIAGVTAIAYKIWSIFKKKDETVDDGQPKKKRWRRKLEESLLKDGEIIVSKEEYEEFLKFKESQAKQA